MISSIKRAVRKPVVAVALAGFAALCCLSVQAEPLYKAAEPIPADAIVLFNGKDLSKWNQCGTDQPAQWKIQDGYIEPQGGDICTKQLFNDCQLHVEFWLPLMADAKGQARANSGVFFKGFTYEVQVLDSYGLDSTAWDCASIYSIKAPIANACRPPQQWQTYDIIFHSPKFDAEGKKTANARITVFQNGVLVQDNTEVPSPTPDHNAAEPKGPGPIELQNHGCAVHYRNIWVRAL